MYNYSKKYIQSYSKFRNNHSFESRSNESMRIKNKYPDKIPVICEKDWNSSIPETDKQKYLVPSDMTISNFLFVIRKRLKLNNQEALFLTIDDIIPSSRTTFYELYEKYKYSDGFLYIVYSKENTFG